MRGYGRGQVFNLCGNSAWIYENTYALFICNKKVTNISRLYYIIVFQVLVWHTKTAKPNVWKYGDLEV